jgi:poly-beta-hydroxyalkanoate depolymerase
MNQVKCNNCGWTGDSGGLNITGAFAGLPAIYSYQCPQCGDDCVQIPQEPHEPAPAKHTPVELLENLSRELDRQAFAIPAPNVHTPVLVSLAIELRNIVYKTIEPMQEANKDLLEALQAAHKLLIVLPMSYGYGIDLIPLVEAAIAKAGAK